MANEPASADLRGRTVRWTFENGPTAGTTFEHRFQEDGSVVWRALDGRMRGASGHEPECATSKVSDNVFVVSYLARSGYTLTVALNTDLKSALGFASNGREWHEMRGTFELVEADEP